MVFAVAVNISASAQSISLQNPYPQPNNFVSPKAAPAYSATDWSVGVKKVLAIRFRFSDQANVDPISSAEVAAAYQQVLQQLPSSSNGLLAFDPQIVLTPTVGLAHPSTFYVGKNWYEEMLSDVRGAAAGAGPTYNALYDSRNYNLDVVISKTLDGSTPTPIAVLGGKGIWAAAAVHIAALAHELGHNLGLSHASSGAHGYATFGPLKINEIVEYGDNHNVMGPGPTLGDQARYQFNPIEKLLLGWLSPNAFYSVTNNGTYRIYAHDMPGLALGQKIGLRVPHTPQEETWYSFRQLFTSNPWSMAGAELHGWNPYIHTFGTSTVANIVRLDANPGTPQGIDDAALVIGRTLRDAYSNVFVTPIGKGGTAPESLDLAVNIGPFPNNVAPIAACVGSSAIVAVGEAVNFTASANDENGDTLAYFWDFGDNAFSSNNSANTSKSWSAAGKYRVSCIISDMKGGEARSSMTITVGAPITASVSGVVTDEFGNPIAGVQVHNGLNSLGNAAYRGTFSASDGSYTITNLSPGSYTLAAGQEQSSFAIIGGWSNPVTVSAGLELLQKNFQRVGGLVNITGKVRAGPAGAFISGITVQIGKSDGTLANVVSDAAGTWQLNVPQGITRATALAPVGSGWTTGEIYPAPGGGFPTPWVVNVGGTPIDNLNFYFRTPELPVVGFQAPTSSASEGAGAAIIPIILTRAAGTRLVMTVRVGSASTAHSGTAISSGSDHYFFNQAFAFPAIDVNNPPGNLIQQVFNLEVPIIDDALNEGDESLVLELSSGQVTYAVSNATHTLTIIDNEANELIFKNGFEGELPLSPLPLSPLPLSPLPLSPLPLSPLPLSPLPLSTKSGGP